MRYHVFFNMDFELVELLNRKYVWKNSCAFQPHLYIINYGRHSVFGHCPLSTSRTPMKIYIHGVLSRFSDGPTGPLDK